MAATCPPIKDLPRIAVLPASDPARSHVAACPRCRARLLAMAAFGGEPRELPGSKPEEARERLDAFLDREFGGTTAAGGDARADAKDSQLRRASW